MITMYSYIQHITQGNHNCIKFYSVQCYYFFFFFNIYLTFPPQFEYFSIVIMDNKENKNV